jgi:diaminopimelate decarboxylase
MSWPENTRRDANGALMIGGVSSVELARSYGTPLYVFDELTLRLRARAIRETFSAAYEPSSVVYAGKAYLSPALMQILVSEDIGLDVVSGGELYGGLAAGVDPARIVFHGNNKSRSELEEAVSADIGLVAIDNDLEIDLLESVAASLNREPHVALRLNPGVDPHTHHKMRTGASDSKFGFPVWDGQAMQAASRIAKSSRLRLAGYHAHVGSQIFDPLLVEQTVTAIMDFASSVRDRFGIEAHYVSPGGGFGVADDASGNDVAIGDWASAAARAIRESCAKSGMRQPTLIVEPGRSIIGPAGVALYEVGARKEIPGLRTYISIDGGMADNIRPSLYGAKYSAAIANRDHSLDEPEAVTIAGKYCESGDILIESIELPRLEPGDLLAVPMAGAYCLSMASNYNMAPRPAVVLISNGHHRLIRRRETHEDLLRCELFDVALAPR